MNPLNMTEYLLAKAGLFLRSIRRSPASSGTQGDSASFAVAERVSRQQVNQITSSITSERKTEQELHMSSDRSPSREILSLNRDWRFHLGEDLPQEAMIFENMQILNNETSLWQKTGNFGISKPGNPYTAEWRSVDLPHDYALEGEFSRAASVGTGSLPHGKAWYVIALLSGRIGPWPTHSD
jgi:hypothetical protein